MKREDIKKLFENATDDQISALLNINSATGEVSLKGPADFDAKGSYSFTISAQQGSGTAATQAVTVSLTGANDEATTFASATVSASINENSAAGVIYTASATHTRSKRGSTTDWRADCTA